MRAGRRRGHKMAGEELSKEQGERRHIEGRGNGIR
jgi:hypothetical protein